MKGSGIEWIGEIPEEWDVLRGKHLLKILKREIQEPCGVVTCFRDGEVTLRSKRRDEGFTFADKEIGYQGIKIGDIAIHGMDGFAGAIGISDSDGKVSPVLSICETIKCNKIFIIYYLRMLATQNVFLALATGIRERSCDLRWNKIAELLFPVPSEEEQSNIANYLDAHCNFIDQTIEKQKQVIEKLKEYKHSVITETVTKGMNPNVPMKDSGIEWIGKIPEHWNICQIKHVCNVIDPQPDHRAPELAVNNGFPYIGIRDIDTEGNLNFDTARIVVEKAIIKQEEAFKVEEDDILFGKVGTLGNPVFIKPKGRFALSATLVLIKVYEKYDKEYVKNVLDSQMIQNQIGYCNMTSTRPSLGIRQIRNFYIAIPNLEEQKHVGDYLKQKCIKIDYAIVSKQEQIDKLESYKKSLIYECVTGKREVK